MRRLIVMATTMVLVWSSLCHAEVAQKEGVRVAVTGSIAPHVLPRVGSTPVAVSIAGRISARDGVDPPQLQRISIAINSHGHLARTGIPFCRLGHIEPSTSREALSACAPALVGEGHFTADVKIPEQSPFPSKGKVLAFNGRLRGRPAIFAHIYGTEPIPTSFVLPFLIKRTPGTFGTVLEASLPRVTGEWGFVTGVSLKLHRTFFLHGRKHSYLSAGCPAPKGFVGAAFALARTRFTFASGLDLSSTLIRNCAVRG